MPIYPLGLIISPIVLSPQYQNEKPWLIDG